MPGNGNTVAPGVRHNRRYLVFVSGHRPNLPTLETVPTAQMKHGEGVVIRDDIPLFRLHVERQEDVENLVTKKPIPHASIEWQHRSVIVRWDHGALLKIKREE